MSAKTSLIEEPRAPIIGYNFTDALWFDRRFFVRFRGGLPPVLISVFSVLLIAEVVLMPLLLRAPVFNFYMYFIYIGVAYGITKYIDRKEIDGKRHMQWVADWLSYYLTPHRLVDGRPYRKFARRRRAVVFVRSRHG